MLRRGAKRARDRCQPGYRARSVQRRQRKVRAMGVRIELRVSKTRKKSDPSDEQLLHIHVAQCKLLR